MKDLVTRNLGLKLAALLMALALWRFVGTEQRSEMAFFVPLEMRGLSPDLVVTQGAVDTVNVRVAGSRAQLAQLDSRQLGVHVDVSGVKPGTSTFVISRDQFSLPPGVEVTRVSPAEIPITVEKLVTKTVEVEAVIVGEPMNGFHLVPEATRVDPPRITVSVPQSQSDGLRRIGTLPIELGGVKGPFRQRVAVDRSDPRARVANPESVVAFVAIEEDQGEKTFDEVAVEVRNIAPGRVGSVVPQRVRLTVRAPLSVLATARGDEVQAWVDARGVDRGDRSLTVNVVLPAALERVRLEPSTVRVVVDTAPPSAGVNETQARKP
ncbi:MAG: hypothetical protein IPK07_04000 [Deltaproteobacteria bacterium]|nr:hypothetical protein [Deltaproteobacteria bacterium]